jgi:prefoldin subunit 5
MMKTISYPAIKSLYLFLIPMALASCQKQQEKQTQLQKLQAQIQTLSTESQSLDTKMAEIRLLLPREAANRTVAEKLARDYATNIALRETELNQVIESTKQAEAEFEQVKQRLAAMKAAIQH